MYPFARHTTTFLVLLIVGNGLLAQAKATDAIFDPSADAKADIAAGMTKASVQHKRVLLMFGGNWCSWSKKMHGTFKDSKVAAMLRNEYVLVKVNIPEDFKKNIKVAQKYGSTIWDDGVPYLTILASDGKVIAHKATKPLRTGAEVDASKIWSFLNKHKAEAPDAVDVLAAARDKAKASRKLLFIHLGEPGQSWCRKLEEFLERKDIASILAKDFIPVKIDLTRMKHGRLMADLIRQGHGGDLPWFMFTDTDMKRLATSDGPKGNVRFPVTEDDIDHFIGMLNKVRKGIADEDVIAIQKALSQKPR